MADEAFAVTDVRDNKELKEVVAVCTLAQKIVTSNPHDAKELLDGQTR